MYYVIMHNVYIWHCTCILNMPEIGSEHCKYSISLLIRILEYILYIYLYTVRSETFAVLNFRGFHSIAQHPRKIKSAKILYDPLCSSLCTGVFSKNKEAGVSNASYIIPFLFSSVMSIKSFFTPIRCSIPD